MTDHTMTRDAACGSARWAAGFMGMSIRTFYSKRPTLEAKGFPRPDPVLNLYIKADVKAWLEKRRRIQDSDKVVDGIERPSINLDAL
ncbi:hypothetical protein KM176_16695 [Pseudooceanicola sp. CBS1P-1]|uniref:AlpA family phage regulatory protein n=1 Tax=Pseudooceanicola albus TaxID=2692189 RepID=A0A6L7G8R9_9RHOB|nr:MULTISPECIES: hypothetical protein [Pseudooceanicola]MBT9385515.1 hypothetical protein [Pseudooceanicola endophyticus]MXN19073.1 hypothetical protein [Pseudooceanicola albus]